MSSDRHIEIDVLGDSSTTSRAGKGIAYHLRAGNARFLIDCGAPVLSLLDSNVLDELDGVIITHAHDDHRRWLSDLLLHRTFGSTKLDRLSLLASSAVLEACRHSLEPALSRTLSDDSTRVEDHPFERFVRPIRLGPAPRFRPRHTGGDAWDVVDREGDPVPLDRARAVLAEGVGRPRLLVRDPDREAWVDPEVFYPFTDRAFYTPPEVASYRHEHASGLTITPVKSTAWHGPPTTSLLFEYGDESVFFSSDTVHDPELWARLAEPLEPDAHPDEEPWRGQGCLRADINRFLERAWSKSRLDRARSLYEGDRVIVHDVAGSPSPVHTHYRHLEDHKQDLLLTHTPETFTARHPIAAPGKTYVVAEGRLWERPDDTDDLHALNAACFHKERHRLYVGVEDPSGSAALRRVKPGVYTVGRDSNGETVRGGLKLYRDLGGRYYPKLRDENAEYVRRPDGAVERRIYRRETSEGSIVRDRRPNLDQPTRPVEGSR